jgi:phytoene dehydrogenase-like protein
MPDAIVIGAGPNGLVAANTLADAGWTVLVLEAQPEPGGAVKSAELTEPGFVNDVFSAFYPFGAASPALLELELERFGLRWRRSELALAHPAGDGTCVAISRDLDETAASLDAFAAGDGDSWRRLFRLWERLRGPMLDAMVEPFPPVGPGARLAAALRADLVRFARLALLPVRRFADEHFRGEGAARLLAGNALHTDVTPETSLGGFFGWLLSSLAQDVGYPLPEGGAGRLADALVARLEARGGAVACSAPVTRVLVRRGRAVGVRTAAGDEVEAERAVLADVVAPLLYRDLLDPGDVPARVRLDLERRFELDTATVKIDWALDAPIPWSAEDARRSAVVHVADSLDELTVTTGELARGLIPARPFLLFGQYAGADPSRCPPGREVAWAYTHVPHRVRGDAGGDLTGAWDERETAAFVERVEARIEALAPGFRALVRARNVLTPDELERRNANLVGGSINGGTAQLHQQAIFRPVPGLGRARTPIASLYLASSSAHPGGGVHGGPGRIAAKEALAARRRGRVAIALGAAAGTGALLRAARDRARTGSLRRGL